MIDGLTNEEEADVYGTDPLAEDTDGDGSTDYEELDEVGTDPLDFDHEHDASGDGISDADTYWLSNDELIAGRAHPLRKDVFVEADWMEGVEKLSDEAKWRIGTRFYENHIWLHIDDGKMGGGGEVEYKQVIEVESNELKPYFRDDMDTDRKGLFHYGLIVDEIEGDTIGFATRAVSAFAVQTDGRGPLEIGSTFMHELGHSFGLVNDEELDGEFGWRHFEGIDSWDISFSNYPSVMNYNKPSEHFGYSDGTNSDEDYDDWSAIKELMGDEPRWKEVPWTWR